MKAINKRNLLLILLLAAIISGCAYTPGKPQFALDGQQSGTIYFTSTDDYDFNRGEPSIPLVIDGTLLNPDEPNGGVVILSHGSGGKGLSQQRWSEFLRGLGFATFSLNHFGPRNVRSTVHGQVRVTEQQMASDIINAGKLLASDPRVDPAKIYHMGWSKGATASLSAAIESSILESTAESKIISGYIAFYPYCGITGDVSSDSSIIIIHGEEDNYTPILPCRRLVKEMKSKGVNIELVPLEGAHHSFDGWEYPLRHRPSALVIRDTSDRCTLKFSKKEYTTTVNGEFTIRSFEERKEFLKACATRGVTTGGSVKHKKLVEGVVRDFLQN